MTELIARLREAGYDPRHRARLHVVEGISDRVIALDHGVKISEGTFERWRPIQGHRGVPRHHGGVDEK
jgi:hypothetical protein